MGTIEYIKETLKLTHVSTSLVPQENGDNIVIEKCLLNDKEVILIYDETGHNKAGKVAIVC